MSSQSEDPQSEGSWQDDTWAQWRKQIDDKLDELRPPRYDVDDKAWCDPVIGWAANTIPNHERILRIHVEQEVARRESLATKSGNQEILKWAGGICPLHWMDAGPKPFSVGKTRVRLDAGTPDDYDRCAYEQKAKADADHKRVYFRAEAMEDLARRARERGFDIVSQIGDQPPRGPGGDQFTDDDDLDDDEDE